MAIQTVGSTSYRAPRCPFWGLPASRRVHTRPESPGLTSAGAWYCYRRSDVNRLRATLWCIRYRRSKPVIQIPAALERGAPTRERQAGAQHRQGRTHGAVSMVIYHEIGLFKRATFILSNDGASVALQLVLQAEL